MSRRRYPACISTYYAPEELQSMKVWDDYCESEPLTLEEIKAANARDAELLPKRKHSALTKEAKMKKALESREYRKNNPEYMVEYRKKNHEEILMRQRAYYRAHKEEILEHKRRHRQEIREKKKEAEDAKGRI